MDVFDCKHGLRKEKLGVNFIKNLSLLQMERQIAGGAEIQNHVQIVWRLERVVHLDHVRVRSLL